MELSTLNKTWILDIDGTVVKHNGHLNGKDELLEGVKEFFNGIDANDAVIFITSRTIDCKEELETFLKINNIRYNTIIYGMPLGERILLNDQKPSGLNTAYAVNKKRDEKFFIDYIINENI